MQKIKKNKQSFNKLLRILFSVFLSVSTLAFGFGEPLHYALYHNRSALAESTHCHHHHDSSGEAYSEKSAEFSRNESSFHPACPLHNAGTGNLLYYTELYSVKDTALLKESVISDAYGSMREALPPVYKARAPPAYKTDGICLQ